MTNEPSRQRDAEFWYDDGNVILVARNVEFRVFKGILAEYSPVFKDMGSLPQPRQEASMSGDSPCPVVHVSDSPEDLRHVLRVYMPKIDASPFSLDDPFFNAISATIRLGHKYQISRLVDHSLAYLKKYYTDDLATWTTNNGLGPPGFTAHHAIGVINLARLTGETALLRTAVLTCCTLDADIVGGLACEDGAREHLSMADLGLCFVVKGKHVQEALGNAIYILAPPVAPSYANPPACKGQLAELTKLVGARVMLVAHLGPFYSVVKLLRILGETGSVLCSHCWALVNRRDAEWRAGLWRNMSDVLGLTDGPFSTVSKSREDGAGDTGASQ